MTTLTPRQIPEQLVKFPTVSRDSSLDLVDWLEAYLARQGIRCFRHWSEDRQKAALIAHAGPFKAAERLDAALKARRPEVGVHLAKFFEFPSLRPEAEGAAEALARSLSGETGTGVVSFGTEAGQFQDAGYSAVVIGPGGIAQAHQPDEYLEVTEFQAGQRPMERLPERLA